MVFSAHIVYIINETIPDYKKKNSKLTHPLFLNSISMSRLENTWLSAHRLHCEEKRRSCQCSAFEEPIHVINCVPCMQFRLHV